VGRAKKCAICTSDPAITGQVNNLIESGVRQKVIHAQHPQFSVSQISRHARFCLQAQGAPVISSETRSAQIERWLQRAESTYALATVNGDSRSAIAAVGAATRALTVLEKQVQAETEAKKDGVDRDSIEVTVKGIDALLRKAAESGDIRNGEAPRTLTLLADEPTFGELVQHIYANRALLPALLATATNYLPERTSEHVHAND